MPKKKGLPTLPGPVLKNIFNYLEPHQLRRCRKTCRLWNRVLIYYNFLPQVPDYYFNFSVLAKNQLLREPTLLLSPKMVMLQLAKPSVALSYSIGSLQEDYMNSCANYVVRQSPSLVLVGFEEMKNFCQFVHPNFLPTLRNIHKLDLLVSNHQKFLEMEMQLFEILIRCLPNLKMLAVPFELLTLVGHDQMSKCRSFMDVKELHIRMPPTPLIMKDEAKYFQLITHVANLLRSSQFYHLESLEISSVSNSKEKKKKKLKAPDINAYLNGIDNFVGELGTHMHKNIVSMVDSKLLLKNFTLRVESFPITAFDNTGILSFFAFIAMRGLRKLCLRVEGLQMATSLPTIIHTMMTTYGCETELDLNFYFGGGETHITSQYLLSLPEMYKSVKSLSIRFLKYYDDSNTVFFLEDLIPERVKLSPTNDLVEFSKMTNLSIEFEDPSTKVFLTFGWLKNIWPNLTHISIIIGNASRYESESSIAWAFFKENWKGIRSTAVSNIFYLRSILKTFPQIESLVMWADLRRANDYSIFVVGPPLVDAADRFNLNNRLPALRKFSLRGLGSHVTSNCLLAFTGMKQLAHLELIGTHTIREIAKKELLQRLPGLTHFKIRL